MMGQIRGRLSIPIPRTPSPNPSLNAPPRPSTSSNRSIRRTEADFEAALLNPNATIFLSASPMSEGGLGTIPASPPRNGGGMVNGGDVDAPIPTEKKSCEQILKGNAHRGDGHRGDGHRGDDNGHEGELGEMDELEGTRGPGERSSTPPLVGNEIQSPAVIPPTPPKAHRRMSKSTVRSNDSAASNMSPSRVSVSSSKRHAPSLGIDAELNEGHKTKPKASSFKRRSIFRSLGTASSPDLATLVRKAKETKGANGSQRPPPTVLQKGNQNRPFPNIPEQPRTMHVQPTQQHAQPTQPSPVPPVSTPKTAQPSQKSQNATPSTTTSPPSNRQVSAHQSKPSQASSSSSPQRLKRAISRASVAAGSEDGWDNFSSADLMSVTGSDRMTPIAEIEMSRSRESAKDAGSKTLRGKAKGVLGKMFGGSTSREHTPHSTPSYPISPGFMSAPEYPRPPPPVPPVPAKYGPQGEVRRKPRNPPPPRPPPAVDAVGLLFLTNRSKDKIKDKDKEHKCKDPKASRSSKDTSRSKDSNQTGLSRVTSEASQSSQYSQYSQYSEASRKSQVSQPSQVAQISETEEIKELEPVASSAQEPTETLKTPTVPTDDHFDTPREVPEGRQSTTPTGRRSKEGSPTDKHKPLPPIRQNNGSPIMSYRSLNGPRRASLHVRQPADALDDKFLGSSSFRTSPRRPVTMSFSEDVAGLFEAIGQNDPAKGLGLPPDSLQSRERSPSADTARGLKGRFPPDLGRSNSMDPTNRAIKPLSIQVGGPDIVSTLSLSPIPTTRTSSLLAPSPHSPRLDQSPRIPQRTTSSPHPSPGLSSVGDHSLLTPNRSLSRSSSFSSQKQLQTDKSLYPSRPAVQRSSPGHDKKEDFTPTIPEVAGDDTIRARRSSDLPPHSPASVRLVTGQSPDVQRNVSLTANEAFSRTDFKTNSPCGRQTPSPRPPSRTHSHGSTDTPNAPRIEIGLEDDRERGRRLACEFLDDDFSSMPSDKVAMFLGGLRRVNSIALRYYMLYFNMKGQTLVDAFRDLCAKLHLKAESQEIDRIIEGFSARYFECNPTTVFGTPGVVHTVTAAMLMLNTDLHIADLSKHMSRNDFVRNAVRAIQESMPGTELASTPDLVRDDSDSIKQGSIVSVSPSSTSIRKQTPALPPNALRCASAPVTTVPTPQPPSRAESERSVSLANGIGMIMTSQARGSSTTISSFNYTKAWETEAEAALKDIYSQVRADKILLPITSAANSNRQSVISLGSDLGRNRTVRSPSGRPNDRVNLLKRGSIRGMQGLVSNNPYASSYAGSEGRLSPTPSYSTSINDVNTFAPTIGFASNLTHTVIREHDDEAHSVNSMVSLDTADEELDDDELALSGAPWAKEGMLWKRLTNEPTVKRTSKKDWKQYFVVVQKGDLLLFTFGEGGGSGIFGAAVGGGNWLNNANTAGRYSLIQTTSSALPGGYSRDRPHVFSVSFPTGEMLYLQAGTDDLVLEWIATCNYWSARKSRQPLQGGVSNMEYGWARVLDTIGSSPRLPDDDRASVRSGRSSMSKMGSYSRRTVGLTPADKMHINDWKPPPPTLMPSPLDEESQLEALGAYVKTVSDELEAHRLWEQPMSSLYTPGSKNAIRAAQNFSSKSKYLVNEIFKYESYVETLRSAIALRLKKQGEKRLEKSLARSITSLHRKESAEGLGDVEEEKDEGRGDGRHGFAERRPAAKGLKIDSSRDGEEDIEDSAITPMPRGRAVWLRDGSGNGQRK